MVGICNLCRRLCRCRHDHVGDAQRTSEWRQLERISTAGSEYLRAARGSSLLRPARTVGGAQLRPNRSPLAPQFDPRLSLLLVTLSRCLPIPHRERDFPETTGVLASVRASFPAITSRGLNADSFNSRANLMLNGQHDWEKCRYTHFAIELSTGRRTLSRETTQVSRAVAGLRRLATRPATRSTSSPAQYGWSSVGSSTDPICGAPLDRRGKCGQCVTPFVDAP
jgi:hypothetical protein